MTQLTIFNQAPATSLAAVRSVEPTRGAKLQQVFEAIVSAGDRGMTDEQLYDGLPGMKPDTIRARRWELVGSSHVADSGERRPFRSGRLGVVWKATGLSLTDRPPGGM